MKRINFLIWLCMALICGCCKDDNKLSTSLIWKCDLESYKWIYNGLEEIFVYNDIVITNTTLASNDIIEDNRLVGVDKNNGKILWMYPSDRSINFNYNFCGNGYLYNNLLLATSEPNGQVQSNAEIHCIDVNTGNKIWSILLRDDNEYIHMTGYDRYAYYQLNDRL